jgi:predicted transcriptional regulator
MKMIPTALGRRVAPDDWRSLHRDGVLVLLYAMRDARGNAHETTTADIRSSTGLSVKDAAELIRKMVQKRLVRTTIRNTIVLRKRGIRWIEESPHSPAGSFLS